MRWNRFLLALSFLVCGAIALEQASASSHHEDALQSFYIARFYFSDYLPGWSNTILEVAPQGNDVRVRLIRISSANPDCPGLLVRAAERVIPHTTVRKVAGRDICSFSPGQVDSALKAAAPKYAQDYSDSATETIVAKCGNAEKEFDFPYPVEVDLKALDRDNPDVSKLWDTRYKIWMRTFGKNFSFDSPAPETQKKLAELGAKLVPELISGKYQTAYNGNKCDGKDCDNYLAWWLRDYAGTPEPYDPGVVTLLNAPSLRFTKYAAPRFPTIAKTAHVYGDVTLRISADPKTGLVTGAEYASGPKLLSFSAIDAAKTWQFDSTSLTGQPFEVTLRYELKCR